MSLPFTRSDRASRLRAELKRRKAKHLSFEGLADFVINGDTFCYGRRRIQDGPGWIHREYAIELTNKGWGLVLTLNEKPVIGWYYRHGCLDEAKECGEEWLATGIY